MVILLGNTMVISWSSEVFANKYECWLRMKLVVNDHTLVRMSISIYSHLLIMVDTDDYPLDYWNLDMNTFESDTKIQQLISPNSLCSLVGAGRFLQQQLSPGLQELRGAHTRGITYILGGLIMVCSTYSHKFSFRRTKWLVSGFIVVLPQEREHLILEMVPFKETTILYSLCPSHLSKQQKHARTRNLVEGLFWGVYHN